MKVELYDDDCDEPIKLPTRKVVCPRCRGEGTHMNPAIDGNGISTDDECWQDDGFREMYFSGGYDVTCEECNGANVIDELDEEAAGPELVERYWRAVQDEMDDRHTRYMESRGWEG